MNKSLKWCLVLLCCILFSIHVPAFAFDTSKIASINALEDLKTGIITVSCTVENPYEGQYVTIMAIKPGKTVADIDYTKPYELANTLYFFDQQEADEYGRVKFVFPLAYEAPSGVYSIGVGGENIEFADRTQFLKFINVINSEELVSQINAAVTSVAMEQIIQDYSELIAFDIKSYQNLSDKSEEKLITQLCDISKRKEFKSIDQFSKTINKLTTVGLINDSTLAESDLLLIKENASVLGIRIDLFTEFDMKDDFLYICEQLKNEQYESEVELKTEFLNYFTFRCVEESKWGYLYERLKTLVNEGVALDLAGCENLSNDDLRATVMQKIAGIHILSIPQLQAELDAAVKAVKQSAVKNPSSNGGGGSGGGKNMSLDIASDMPLQQGNTDIFSDLETVKWAKEAVEFLAKQNIVTGKSEGKFVPQEYVKREELVKMLVLTLGLNAGAQPVSFQDVHEDDWFYNYVASAVERKLILGFDAQSFGIGSNITRQQLATILWRAIKDKAIETQASEIYFDDDEEIADYAKEAVYHLVKLNIISGKGNNLFQPNEPATRAETAKLLYEMVKGGYTK